MSTTRFMNATAVAVQTTTPSTVGRSWVDRARDREPAEALDVEDGLGDDRAADEQRDVEAEDRHDRRQARAQPVLEDHLALGEPLGARGPDVVLAERLEQVVPRQPRVDRHVEEREHGPGQDHVAEPLPDSLVDRRCSPEPAGEAELLPDDVERHQPEPEDGRRDPEEGEAHRRPVDHGSALLTAESTPIVTPKTSQIDRGARRSRRSVRGARVMISLRTET